MGGGRATLYILPMHFDISQFPSCDGGREGGVSPWACTVNITTNINIKTNISLVYGELSPSGVSSDAASSEEPSSSASPSEEGCAI
jgi:hypothetical protein